MSTTARRFLDSAISLVPKPNVIADKNWNARHHGVLMLLWLHAPALTAFGFYRGAGAAQSVGAGALIALLAIAAYWRAPGRTARSVIASIGLLTCSAVLVNFAGGRIEAHFHFFVMVSVIAVYEDWIPYLTAILYIVLEHGLLGRFMPASVYDQPDAFIHPWKWAFIHAGLILCMVIVQVAARRAGMRPRTRDATLEFKDVMGQVRLEKYEAARIIDEISDGVVMTGPAGDAVLMNPAARRYLSGDMPQSPPSNRSRMTNNTPLAEFFENHDEPTTQEFEVYDAAHLTTRLFSATAVPLKDDRGYFLGTVAVFRDITIHKEADHLKSEFISHVSHELRTPLTAIKGYIENLRDGLGGTLTVKQLNYLDRLTINTNHLARLISDLLDISKIETGRMTLCLAPLSMQHLIEQAVEDMRPLVAQHQLEMCFEPLPDERPVNGDRDRLQQVIANLLDNAVKFTPPGGRITIVLRQDGNWLTTTIRDTGIGIPLDMQSRVFERFSRTTQASPATVNGTGLGLYICKTIIEMHGGRIRLVSEAGRGCEFSFVLPSHSG